MKFLSQFEKFNWDAFAKGKTFMCNGTAPWTDRETGALLGTKVECVIMDDETEYQRKEGDTTTNRFEKIAVKVAKPVVVPGNATVKLVDVVATIYGDYRNQLSVKAADIEVVRASKT